MASGRVGEVVKRYLCHGKQNLTSEIEVELILVKHVTRETEIIWPHKKKVDS